MEKSGQKINLYPELCGGLNLTGCEILILLTSLSFSSTEQGEKMRQKCSQVEIDTI